MHALALDHVTGDLSVSTGRAAIVDGPALTAQTLRLRLSLAKGTWFLDLERGIPYDQILDKVSSLSPIDAVFRAAITGCPGVKAIRSLSLSQDSARRLSVGFEVVDVTGTVITDADVGAF